jgi:hypothetical protein
MAVDGWVVENGVGSLPRMINVARTMNTNSEVAEVLDSIQNMADELKTAMITPD